MSNLLAFGQADAVAQHSRSVVLSTVEFLAEQLTPLLCVATPLAMLVLLFLGMSDRVVVFFDAQDVFWSLMPFISLVGSSLIAVGLSVTAESPELRHSTARLIDLVMTLGLLASALSLVISVYNSIYHNRNFALGLLLGFFKVNIALLMGILTLSQLSKAFKVWRGNVVLSMSSGLLFAYVTGWLWTRLVNGPRVYSRRGWLMQTDRQSWTL